MLMIIDFHTHCFPDFLAPKAMGNLASVSQYPPVLNGTVADLSRSMRDAGINKSVVLNIATNARQTPNVNDFAISLAEQDEFIPFGSVHPDYENITAELARLNAAGIKGIKFHPDFQDFEVDDKKMYGIYEKAAAMGFILLFHCGMDLDIREYKCAPEKFAKVVRDFKGAKIVGAHLGGQGMWDGVFEYVCGTDVYVDTSYALCLLTDEQLKRLLSEHDNSKILFGTDSPWQSQMHDVIITQSRICDSELLNKIMGGNAENLLEL